MLGALHTMEVCSHTQWRVLKVFRTQVEVDIHNRLMVEALRVFHIHGEVDIHSRWKVEVLVAFHTQEEADIHSRWKVEVLEAFHIPEREEVCDHNQLRVGADLAGGKVCAEDHRNYWRGEDGGQASGTSYPVSGGVPHSERGPHPSLEVCSCWGLVSGCSGPEPV